MTRTGTVDDKAVRPNPFHDARILITGGAGFVGRKLASRLGSLLPAAQVVLASRAAVDGNGNLIAMDLEVPASVDRAVAEVSPDLIIHLAAQSSVGQTRSNTGRTWSVNAAGTLHLATAIAAHRPDATVLYASSSEVYGLAFNQGIVSETSVPLPQSAYSRSKLAAEYILDDVLSPENRLIVARASNHSGAGQDQRFVLPSFAAQIASGASEIHVGNLSAERDFLHVEDVVDAYAMLLGVADELEQRSTFNIASGQTVSVGDLLDRLIALAQSSAVVVVDPLRLRPSDIAVVQIDAGRLRSATGWQPSRSTDQMLREVLDDQGRNRQPAET